MAGTGSRRQHSVDVRILSFRRKRTLCCWYVIETSEGTSTAKSTLRLPSLCIHSIGEGFVVHDDRGKIMLNPNQTLPTIRQLRSRRPRLRRQMRAEVNEVSSSLVQNALLDLEAVHYAADRERRDCARPRSRDSREGAGRAAAWHSPQRPTDSHSQAAADACGGSSATASGLSSKSVCLV